MRGLPALLSALMLGCSATAALGCSATAALGQASLVSDGRVRMRLDPRASVLSCIVVATSGDAATDDDACRRALNERWQSPDPLPPDVGIIPDREGRFVDCSPPEGATAGADFRQLCTARLARLRLARAMVPIAIETWLEPVNLTDLPDPVHSGRVRLGISEEGRPIYCLIVASTGNAGLDGSLCSALMERARFQSARDEQGRAMPSVFNVGL